MDRQTMIELGYIPTFNHRAMKLKLFNPENCQPQRKVKELNLILRRNGSVCFTKPTLEHLKIKAGSQIEFCQDTEKGDWYVYHKKGGFEVKNIGQQLGFTSAQLVNYMWPGRQKTEKSRRGLISETPIRYEAFQMYLIVFP